MGMDWKWIVLCGSFLARIVTTGTVVCMGVFYNEFEQSFTHWQTAKLAAIFSTAVGMLESTGIVASLLIKKFESRHLVIGGGILAAIGVAAASQASDYVQMIIFLGVLNGIGQGIGRCLLPIAVAHSFRDGGRDAAVAFQSVGDGVGGLIFPIFFKYLIDKWGWRGALLITAGIICHLLVAGVIIQKHLQRKKTSENDDQQGNEESRQRPLQRYKRQVAGLCVELSPNVELLCLNVLGHSLGYYVFMTFIYNELTETQKIDPTLASAMVACVGGVSIVGRLLVLPLDNKRVPRWLIYAIMHICRGLVVLACNAVPYLESRDHRIIAYFVLCSSYGMTDGVSGAMIPVMCLDLFGLERMADTYGYLLFFIGTGALVGSPLAGAMKDAFSSSELPLTFSGVSFIFAGAILLPLFFTKKHYQLVSQKKQEVEMTELTTDNY